MSRKQQQKRGLAKLFDKFSTTVTKVTGKPIAFIIAFFTVAAWAISGPILGFSETWQLLINTITTVITFLMVFIIQQAQNKDTVAIHLKLNELIAATKGASNRLIDVEDLTADELEKLKAFFIKLSDLAEKEDDISCTHTIEEAEGLHRKKSRSKPRNALPA